MDYDSDTATGTEMNLPPSCVVKFTTGFASKQGRRPTMEDEHVIIEQFHPRDAEGHKITDTTYAYFAVFDGHGGKDSAKFASLFLHDYLAVELGKSGRGRVNIKRAMQKAVLKLDDEFLRSAEKHDLRGGSTAIIALIVGRILYIAGTGSLVSPISVNRIHLLPSFLFSIIVVRSHCFFPFLNAPGDSRLAAPPPAAR